MTRHEKVIALINEIIKIEKEKELIKQKGMDFFFDSAGQADSEYINNIMWEEYKNNKKCTDKIKILIDKILNINKETTND